MSSIGKKQVVATTGLLLIIFLIGHLAGNLFIYAGPETFNNYAKKLAGLRPFLYLIEIPLAAVFLIHIYITLLLVLENFRARDKRYAVSRAVGQRSLATRLMPYTGTIVFLFVIWHLLDFTFSDHHGPRAIMPDGRDLGLYGVVYNSFTSPWHSFGYIVAMMAIGFHLAHGIQSFFQTFGVNHPVYTVMIQNTSNALGILMAVAYSSIPVYVLFMEYSLK